MKLSATDLLDIALLRSGFPIRGKFLDKRILVASEIDNVANNSAGEAFCSKKDKDLYIRYRPHSLIPFDEPSMTRDFLRYDFQQEWNNKGYGRISTDSSSPFSCSQAYFLEGPNVEILAEVFDRQTGKKLSDYAALIEKDNQSILWFNRPVGPLDGYDWVIVEEFLASYRAGVGGSFPCVSEIPFGYQGAMTMRIDCDEAVASGRRLFELYRKKGMPFSMAIKTQQELGGGDKELITEVLKDHGSVVGHSHTHAPNWGGSAASAQWEITECHKALNALNIDGINYDYVVSPFHQNPPQSVQGLRDAGIKGFVGGIICNDPEYLMARAGAVPGVSGIISHSQQCMLHGETFHNANNSIQGYKEAFLQAVQTRTFFGYLDHPFSGYWYGWASEDERLSAHEQFLNYIFEFPKIWKANLVDAMRFLEMKSTVKITKSGEVFKVFLPFQERFKGLPPVRIDYEGRAFLLNLGDQVDIA